MSDVIQITVSTDVEENAHAIAEALVTKRLAASCWVSGPIISRYWWQGVGEQAQEWVCTAKTRARLYSEVEQAIKELHPYEIPGILATPVTTGSQDYFDWIEHETRAQNQPAQQSETKEQIIARYIAAHEQLLAAARTAHERGEVGTAEAWGPREVLGHVAGWAAQATAILSQVFEGHPPQAYAGDAQHDTIDDAFNRAFIALLGGQSFEQVVQVLCRIHHDFVQVLQAEDERAFVPGNPLYEHLQRVIAHHVEHAQTL